MLRDANRPNLRREIALAERAGPRIAGVDEVGRGAWAGPVVAAAIVLPLDNAEVPLDLVLERLGNIRDSKQMTPAQREVGLQAIQAVAVGIGMGQAEVEEIDRLGIAPATRLAMKRAILALPVCPCGLVIDAVRLPELPIPQDVLYHADALCLSVAAASVVAKVSRDRQMRALDGWLPGYEMGQHKGYGTARHQTALAALGPSAIHRRSFAPVRERLAALASGD